MSKAAKEIDLFYSNFIIEEMKRLNKKFYYNDKHDILSSEPYSLLKEISYEEARQIFSNPKKIFFSPPCFSFITTNPPSYFNYETNNRYKIGGFEVNNQGKFLFFRDNEYKLLLEILPGIAFKYDKATKYNFIETYSSGKCRLFTDKRALNPYIEKNIDTLIVQKIMEKNGLKNIISQIYKNMYGIGNFNDILNFIFNNNFIKPEDRAEIFGAFIDNSTQLFGKKQNCEIFLNYCIDNHRSDIEIIKKELAQRGLIDLDGKNPIFEKINNDVSLINFSYLELVKRYPVKLHSEDAKKYYESTIQSVASSLNRILSKNPNFGINHINFYKSKDMGYSLLLVKNSIYEDSTHTEQIQEIFLDGFKYVNDFFNNQIDLCRQNTQDNGKDSSSIRYITLKYHSYQGQESLSQEKIDSILKTVVEKHAISFAINNASKNSENINQIGLDKSEHALESDKTANNSVKASVKNKSKI